MGLFYPASVLTATILRDQRLGGGMRSILSDILVFAYLAGACTDRRRSLAAGAMDVVDDELKTTKTSERQSHVAMTTTTTPPRPDNETITLDQFLVECNRSPRSRVGKPTFCTTHTTVSA